MDNSKDDGFDRPIQCFQELIFLIVLNSRYCNTSGWGRELNLTENEKALNEKAPKMKAHLLALRLLSALLLYRASAFAPPRVPGRTQHVPHGHGPVPSTKRWGLAQRVGALHKMPSTDSPGLLPTFWQGVQPADREGLLHNLTGCTLSDATLPKGSPRAFSRLLHQLKTTIV